MLTVWNKSELFDETRAALSTWIYAIARNKHLDHLRRVRPEPDAEDPCWVQGGPGSSTPSESSILLNERFEQLRQAVDVLPDELRLLLAALYQEGKSMSEVAEATNTPLGTIKTRARRALSSLRDQLTKDET